MNPLLTAVDVGGVWRYSYFLGVCVFLVFIAQSGFKRFGMPICLLWLWAALSAVFILEYPGTEFLSLHTAFQATAGQCLVELLVIPIGVYFLRDWVLKLMPYVVIFEILAVWLHRDGLMVAPSFNTALIALCLPFIHPWLILVSLVTICSFHGSTALLIVAAQMLAIALKVPKFRKFFVGAVAILAWFAYYHHHGALLDGEERLSAWTRYMSEWALKVNIPYKDPIVWDWKNIILGQGAGTFMWMSLMIDKYKGALFLCMHCDYLQLLFELGFVGLSLAIATLVRSIRVNWKNPQMLSAILGASAFCFSYHPIHFFPSAVVMLLIFSYKED